MFLCYMLYVIVCWTFMCMQHGLKFMYKFIGSCHMYCTSSSITLHSKLYIFSLFIFIIDIFMLYLFSIQVEPVFYLGTIKSYPNHFCVH